MGTAGGKGRKVQKSLKIIHATRFSLFESSYPYHLPLTLNCEKWVSPAISKNCIFSPLSSILFFFFFCFNSKLLGGTGWHTPPRGAALAHGYRTCAPEDAAGMDSAVSRGWEAPVSNSDLTWPSSCSHCYPPDVFWFPDTTPCSCLCSISILLCVCLGAKATGGQEAVPLWTRIRPNWRGWQGLTFAGFVLKERVI